MTKYYLIPIDTNGFAYFGIRSTSDPYTFSNDYWCAGTPNVFGGNAQGTPLETLYKECLEESRRKIELDYHTINSSPTMLVRVRQTVINHQAAEFFALRAHFTYDPNALFTNVLLKNPKWSECTGDVICVQLGTIATGTAEATADALLAEADLQLLRKNTVSTKAIGEFRGSEMVIAVQNAAIAVQNKQL